MTLSVLQPSPFQGLKSYRPFMAHLQFKNKPFFTHYTGNMTLKTVQNNKKQSFFSCRKDMQIYCSHNLKGSYKSVSAPILLRQTSSKHRNQSRENTRFQYTQTHTSRQQHGRHTSTQLQLHSSTQTPKACVSKHHVQICQFSIFILLQFLSLSTNVCFYEESN